MASTRLIAFFALAMTASVATIPSYTRADEPVWTKNGQLAFPQRFSPYTRPVFSPDGKTIAIAGKESDAKAFRQEDGVVLLYDVEKKKLKARWLLGKRRMPGKLQWHPNGKVLVISVAAIGTVSIDLWDVARQRVLNRIALPKNPGIRTSRGWSLSPDGKILAVGDWGRGVVIYNVKTQKALRVLESARVTSLQFSPDGRTIAVGSWAVGGGLGAGNAAAKKSTYLWDWRKGKLKASLPWQLPEKLTFSQDGKHIVATWLPLAKKVKSWDIAAGKEVDLVPGVAPEQVLFSPDGRSLFVLEPPAPQNLGRPATLFVLEVWDRNKKKKIQSIDAQFTSGVSLSPDGYLLAVSSLDNPIGMGPGNEPGKVQLWRSNASQN